MTTKHRSDYRRYLRTLAKADSFVPIRVEVGAEPPRVEGEFGRYLTPGGRPVKFPNAYRRAWGKPVYHASTVAVLVGTEWLHQKCIPVEVCND